MGSRKQDGRNVDCLSTLQRQAEGRETPGVIINTQQAWVQGWELTHTSFSYTQAWLGSGMNEQIWLFLNFRVVHFLSFPVLFTGFISEKLEKRKYMYFHFRRRFPKYVKLTGETDQEWVQVKRQGERNTREEFCNGLLPSKWSARPY